MKKASTDHTFLPFSFTPNRSAILLAISLVDYKSGQGIRHALRPYWRRQRFEQIIKVGSPKALTRRYLYRWWEMATQLKATVSFLPPHSFQVSSPPCLFLTRYHASDSKVPFILNNERNI